MRYYKVTEEELNKLRADFQAGRYVPKMENTFFDLDEHERFCAENKAEIDRYTKQQQAAMDIMNREEDESQDRLAKAAAAADAKGNLKAQRRRSTLDEEAIMAQFLSKEGIFDFDCCIFIQI